MLKIEMRNLTVRLVEYVKCYWHYACSMSVVNVVVMDVQTNRSIL